MSALLISQIRKFFYSQKARSADLKMMLKSVAIIFPLAIVSGKEFLPVPAIARLFCLIMLLNQKLIPDQVETEEFLNLCKNLLTEYKATSYTNQMDVLAVDLKIMMIKLANVKMVKEDTFDSQDYIIYRKFMELLSSQYHSLHAVNDYSERLNITPRRLSELCKRCSDKSAKEIINGQIIAEAKRLLQFSSHSVKEIAYQLHFGTSEQFSHFFKKNTEISPANYRSKFIHIGI